MYNNEMSIMFQLSIDSVEQFPIDRAVASGRGLEEHMPQNESQF